MEKKIEDYLHLYLGCKVEYDGRIGIIYTYYHPAGRYNENMVWVCSLEEDGNPEMSCAVGADKVKPILRPLSDMTEEEMIQLLQILFAGVDDKIADDELQIEMFYWDNSTMVDGDIQVGCNVSCRCFEGQLCVRECGSIMLMDEEGVCQRLQNVPAAINYMRSKTFDCDGLIESGLAIDKTTL